jgi:hypothetical protein
MRSARGTPLTVYVALAPFIGRGQAGEFVLGKLSGRDSDTSAVA